MASGLGNGPEHVVAFELAQRNDLAMKRKRKPVNVVAYHGWKIRDVDLRVACPKDDFLDRVGDLANIPRPRIAAKLRQRPR